MLLLVLRKTMMLILPMTGTNPVLVLMLLLVLILTDPIADAQDGGYCGKVE